MSLDIMYINKAEEIMKKQHNTDLQSSTEALLRYTQATMLTGDRESKGDKIVVPVVIKGQEVLSYVMRIGENMPAFNFWPRGREIIQRLVLRAALSDGLNEFKLYRTSEESIKSIIFNRKLTESSTDDF